MVRVGLVDVDDGRLLRQVRSVTVPRDRQTDRQTDRYNTRDALFMCRIVCTLQLTFQRPSFFEQNERILIFYSMLSALCIFINGFCRTMPYTASYDVVLCVNGPSTPYSPNGIFRKSARRAERHA